MTRPTPKQEAALLAWVNRQRKELGREPIERLERGARGIGESCPLAKSLGPGAAVDDYEFEVIGTPGVYDALPKYIQVFIRRFDAGEYPGLEVGNA